MCDLSEQTQNRQANHEPIRRVAALEAERGAQRAALRRGKRFQLREHRYAHLMQRGERELALSLDTGGSDNPATRGVLERVVQQRGLSDADVPPEHHCSALAGAEVSDEAVEFLAFAAPVQQHRADPPER